MCVVLPAASGSWQGPSAAIPETTAEEAAQLSNDRAAPDGHREVDLDQPIRVLLVDDFLEAREKVRAMLHKRAVSA